LIFPKQGSDHNGFAIVDVLNTVLVGNKDFPDAKPLPIARTGMGDDFLFGLGNAYVGVVWDKFTVPGGIFPRTVVDHRAFDGKDSLILVGNDEEELRTRLGIERWFVSYDSQGWRGHVAGRPSG
jgi:hypothetical protein